jgi:hypothetical protein
MPSKPVRSQAEFDSRARRLEQQVERLLELMRPHIYRAVDEVMAPLERKVGDLEQGGA